MPLLDNHSIGSASAFRVQKSTPYGWLTHQESKSTFSIPDIVIHICFWQGLQCVCLFVVLQWRAHFQLKTKRLKQKDLNVAAPFVWQTFELESWLLPVWGRYLFFLVIVKSGYLKIKKMQRIARVQFFYF